MASPDLACRRVLVVEDEYFLMDDLCERLRLSGAVVVGPAPSIRDALGLIAADPGIDAAVLDLNLRGEMAYPVVDALLMRGIPVVFSTGYAEGAIPPRYAEVKHCGKLAGFDAIAEALAVAMGR